MVTIFILKLMFLFCIGSMLGWCLEVVYRRIVHKKWINPGFLTGPCLPLYGYCLIALYLMSQINVSFIPNIYLQKIVLFVIMSLVITLVEYLAGLIFIKGMNVKLWDYSGCWGNIQGIICPLYTFFWWLLSAAYYFLIHPKIISSLEWLDDHIIFSFVIGMFHGILLLDFVHSINLTARITKFAKEKNVVVKMETFKESIENGRFMKPIHTEVETLRSNLSNYLEKEKEEFKLKKEALESKEKKLMEKRAKKSNKK